MQMEAEYEVQTQLPPDRREGRSLGYSLDSIHYEKMLDESGGPLRLHFPSRKVYGSRSATPQGNSAVDLAANTDVALVWETPPRDPASENMRLVCEHVQVYQRLAASKARSHVIMATSLASTSFLTAVESWPYGL